MKSSGSTWGNHFLLPVVFKQETSWTSKKEPEEEVSMFADYSIQEYT
jgi:hypothetical protein